MKRIYNYFLVGITALFAMSCHDFLEEKVYTEYDPNTFLADQSGIDALLTGAYAQSRIISYGHRNYTYLMNEFTTDIAFESGGGLERDATPFMNFTWDASNAMLNGFWTQMYGAIASANNILNVVDGLTGISEEQINKIRGEARFIRAASYYYLYNLFGTVPIIEYAKGTAPDKIEEIGKTTPRAKHDVFVKYLVDDLTFAAEHLGVEENPIGRATRGSALAVLTKLYLHEKDWANVVSAADKILALNYYSLYPNYKKLFSVEGEDNKEYIYRAPCLAIGGYENNYMPHAFPPGYPVNPSSLQNFGAQFRTYTDFYETFEQGDSRRESFVTEYVNLAKEPVKLLRDNNGQALNNVRSFKYWPDPNGSGAFHGNDIVYIRLADIILAKAEAMNEQVTKPTQAILDLINQIRNRAHATPVSLSEYATKTALRDFILAERGREFFSEGVRREDLIRHGKFISSAVARGKNAKPYHVLFPIPRPQLEANNSLEQNEGYKDTKN